MERADPMLAMASNTGVVANGLSNALAVGLWDAQQLEKMSSGSNGSLAGGETKPAPINPLLLASASFGSWTALNYLFSKEDKLAPPMIQPTQVFLDLLVGNPASNNSRGRLTVQQPSEDVEDVVDQPASSKAGLLLKSVTANGDTALHAVASNGDSKEFLKCAVIIFRRDQDLLFAVNKKGDTPLHFAARAGKSKMLSSLVDLAESCNRLHELLRKENVLQETALHDAVRIGNEDIVERLLKADPDLANYPKEGTSSLYLAISLQRYTIARTLHDKSNGNLSYFGPDGQNALHAAIMRASGITEHLLNWNNRLTTHGDRDGSTPLHFASVFWGSDRFRKLLEANPAPVYQADNNGLFPIHVAASLGAENVLNIILDKFPRSAGLRNAQGQTFLHVAIEKGRLNIVYFVCQNPSLNWILNMRDNDGNTALHFAVKSGILHSFCSLCGNMEVDLSLANNNKETPLDLARSLFRRGANHIWNSDQMVYEALHLVGAKHSCVRFDQFVEKYSHQLKPEDEVKEAEKMKEASQMLGIGAVLIATMSFGATFAVPGGFIADNQTNGGTPTLAGRYTFDAFMMANALAFICSSIATVGLMFTGSPLVNLVTRQMNYGASVFFMSSSLTCLATAFALGVYMVLAPVAKATGIAIFVLSPLVMLYRDLEFLLKLVILVRPLCLRMGLFRALKQITLMIAGLMLMELWPFILIIGWAAIARKLRNL